MILEKSLWLNPSDTKDELKRSESPNRTPTTSQGTADYFININGWLPGFAPEGTGPDMFIVTINGLTCP